MNKFFALFFVVAIAQAKPSGIAAPLVLPAIAIPAEISTQYHAQDSAGQYTYGYSNPLSAKAEVRSFDGVTKGAYNYLDGEGKIQSVSYLADAKNGFQLTSATNLPQAPPVPKVPQLIAPVAVEDTPEVVEARARHLDALKEAEVRATAEPATIVTETKTTLPAVNAAVASIPVPAPVFSYNIPGATVTYSTYPAQLLAAYNPHLLSAFAPVQAFPAFAPIPGIPALPALPGSNEEKPQVDVQNDSVTIEAKESKEKSD